MYESECFASCPEATVATSTTTCEGTLLLKFNLTFLQDCPDHCDECSSTSVCTKCKDSYHLYKDECFDPCPDETFADTTMTCEGTNNSFNI